MKETHGEESHFSPEDFPGGKMPRIDIYPEKPVTSQQELRETYSGKMIYACDFYIGGIEAGKEFTYGFSSGGIIAIDHHAPVESMQRPVCSTNFAVEYVKKNGIVDEDAVVVINHVDTDSVLSSAILRGAISPEQKYIEAAVAADHTGDQNEISDLLQSLMSEKNINFSLRNLLQLLHGQELDPMAQELRDKRIQARRELKEMVRRGEMRQKGNVFFMVTKEKVDGALLVPSVPGAEIIITFNPLVTNPVNWEAEVRLGKNARPGLTLHKLQIQRIDPAFGCRWNAGANNRAGGTEKSPDEYADQINRLLKDM